MASDPWCPLLALPAELRNNIWEEVFEGNEVQISTTRGSDKGSAAPALLLTCKLIYSEATSVYYALSDFQAVTLSYHRLADRLVCLPKSSFNLIQRISIHLIHHPNSYIEPEVWASRAQENVLRMRKKLIASSHPDAHCVKIRTVVYDIVGSKYWTSTPWETFVALINAPSGRCSLRHACRLSTDADQFLLQCTQTGNMTIRSTIPRFWLGNVTSSSWTMRIQSFAGAMPGTGNRSRNATAKRDTCKFTV